MIGSEHNAGTAICGVVDSGRGEQHRARIGADVGFGSQEVIDLVPAMSRDATDEHVAEEGEIGCMAGQRQVGNLPTVFPKKELGTSCIFGQVEVQG